MQLNHVCVCVWVCTVPDDWCAPLGCETVTKQEDSVCPSVRLRQLYIPLWHVPIIKQEVCNRRGRLIIQHYQFSIINQQKTIGDDNMLSRHHWIRIRQMSLCFCIQRVHLINCCLQLCVCIFSLYFAFSMIGGITSTFMFQVDNHAFESHQQTKDGRRTRRGEMYSTIQCQSNILFYK